MIKYQLGSFSSGMVLRGGFYSAFCSLWFFQEWPRSRDWCLDRVSRIWSSEKGFSSVLQEGERFSAPWSWIWTCALVALWIAELSRLAIKKVLDLFVPRSFFRCSFQVAGRFLAVGWLLRWAEFAQLQRIRSAVSEEVRSLLAEFCWHSLHFYFIFWKSCSLCFAVSEGFSSRQAEVPEGLWS